MAGKDSHKETLVVLFGIILFTISVGVFCLYDLYRWFEHIKTINQITLIQIIYSVFLIGLWVVCGFSLFYGFLALHIYIKTRCTIESIPSQARDIRVRDIMKELSKLSRAEHVITGGRYLLFYVGLIGVLAFFVFSNWRLLFIPLLVATVQIWLWIRISTPPIIILLSSSHPKCLSRHWAYKRLASPLRVVTLLDFDQVHSKKIEQELHLDCLRATNDDDWWPDIKILLDLTPIIIIDTSIDSDGVLNEAKYVYSAKLTYKSIFLTDNQGEKPLLKKLEGEQPIDFTKLFVTDENRAIKLVKSLIAQRIFPKQNTPLTSISWL